jgi:hypothetical protein
VSLDPRTLRRTSRLRGKGYARYAGIPSLPSLRSVQAGRSPSRVSPLRAQGTAPWPGRVEAPLWRPRNERENTMSNKPTHTAFVVIDPREGSDRKAQWIEVGAVWPHKSGKGFDLVIPDGISLSGRIVCRERKEQPAE